VLLSGWPAAYATSLSFQGYVQTVATGSGITLSSPADIAVDAAGNVYIADTGNSRIVEVTAQGAAAVLTIAGLSPALSSPSGLAVDGADNLYIADTGNNRVVMVTASGAGSAVGTGSVTLSGPKGVALDPSGDLFIADTGNNRIVEVTAGGSAAAVALGVTSGSATLSAPAGLAVSAGGQLYIADTGNNRIVGLAAGSTAATALSIAGLSALSAPGGVAVDGIGNIYIADTGNNRIAEVDTAGNGYTLFSTTYLGAETLSGPLGVAVGVFGTVYVADSGNSRSLAVNPWLDGDATTNFYASSLNSSAVGFGHVQLGSASAVSLALTFTTGSVGLGGVSVVTSGAPGLDFTPGASTTCGGTTASGTTCVVEVNFLPTAAGLRSGAVVLYDAAQNPLLTLPVYGFSDAPVAALTPDNTGSVLGTGGVALSDPFQAALDGAGNLYVGNYTGSNVTEIAAGGGSATVLSLGSPGGTPLDNITGVAVDGAGNVFLGDHQNSRIVVATPGGVVSVLSISGLSPSLGFPTALAFDAGGNLYIADFTNGRVVKVSSLVVAGSTATGRGTALSTGSYSFPGSTLTGMAVDPQGTVYLAAQTDNNSSIVKVTAAGAASLLTPAGLTFSNPQGVAADAMGNLYVVDTGNGRIVRITPAGVTTAVTIGGLSNASALSSLVFGTAVDSFGNLYIPDWSNNRIVYVNVSGAALSFATTNRGQTSSDSPRTATVTNLGDEPLVFTANPAYTASFSEDTADANPCGSSTALAAGAACDVAVEFTPESPGSLSASITLTDNALNVAGTTQLVAVSGMAVNPGDTTATTVSIYPAALTNGQTATIVAMVADTESGNTATAPSGAVTFTDMAGTTVTMLNGGAAVSLNGGTATLTGVLLSGIGAHTVTANYDGVSGSFLSSSSTTAATVSKAAVTVSGPAAQPVAVTAGQAGATTVTVTGAYATLAPPSGTVSYSLFDASGTTVATGTPALTAGSGSSTAAIPIPGTLASGSYTLSVSYGGDSNYLAAATPATITVLVGQIATAISWSPSASAIPYGTTLSGILDATAMAGATTGSTPVTGSFAYTATPAGGPAATVTSASVLGAGSYTLTATFTPADPATYTGGSKTVMLTVNQAAQTISFPAPAASVAYGSAPLTLSATGGASGNAVTFSVTGPATLSGSTLTFTGAGAVTVTAAQAGNSNYTAAAPVTHTITVTQETPAVSLASSMNPALATGAVTFTAMVTAQAGTPSGTVSFFDGGTKLGTGTLGAGTGGAGTAASGETAALTTSALSTGSHTITAVYSGDTNFSAVTSSAVAEVVEDFSVGVASSGGSGGSTQSAYPGGTATYSLAFGPAGGTTFLAAVSLSVSGLPPGASATLTPQTIPAGSGLTDVTLSIQLAAATAGLHPEGPPPGRMPALVWGVLLLPFLGSRGLGSRGASRRRRLGLVLLLAAAAGGLSGCGALHGFFGQTFGQSGEQTYTITVTATSGTLSHTTTVTLTVE
jgi:sugar lactone lactonase YvrE